MKVKMTVLSVATVALVGIIAISSPSSAWAEDQPQGQMMQGMKMGQGGGTGMPQGCQKVMAMRQSMRAEQASQDAKLNDLVAKMNAAGGDKKVDAIAAVVSEMVAQRQARHAKMAGVMADCPANCPMMQRGGGAAPAKPEKKAE